MGKKIFGIATLILAVYGGIQAYKDVKAKIAAKKATVATVTK
jgi:hypothetical protein